MLKEWFVASELAGIEGLPNSKSGVIRAAKKGEWVSRECQTKGGVGLEYHISALPEATQKALKKAEIEAETATEAGQTGELAAQKILLSVEMEKQAEKAARLEGMKLAMSLTGKTAARDAAKHVIISAFKEWHQAKAREGVTPKRQGQYGTALLYEFTVAYNQGEIPVDEQTRAIKPTIDQTSLWRWMDKLRHGEHLGGKYGHRKGCGMIDTNEDMKTAIVGMLANTPHVSSKTIYSFVVAKFEGQAPSKRNLERWVAQWKVAHAGLFQAHSNPDAWKNENMVAYGSLTSDVERMNQRWALDSSPADLMLEDGRYQLLLSVDLYSRIPKFLVAKTSKAVAVAALLRRCILDWGVPEEIKTDNGQDYASLHVKRACNLLGINQNFSQPFSPWEKGNVERMFRSFMHGLFELLPGFLGHNVAEQQEIRARKAFSERLFKKDAVIKVDKMNAAQFQEFCDQWVRDIYLREPHAGLEGTTPFLKAQECRATVSRIDDERVLDMLLAEAPGRDGVYTLQKKGLHIEKGWYFDAAMALYAKGTEMRVLRLDSAGEVAVYAEDRPDDPLDLNAKLPGFHFVCIARCPERAGMSREEHRLEAIKAKHVQTKHVQKDRKRLKEIVKESGATDAVPVILDAAQAKHGNVHAFPKPSMQHTGVGIDAAREAVKALDAQAVGGGSSPDVGGGSSPDAVGNRSCLTAKLEEIKALPKAIKPQFESAFQRVQYLMGELVNGRGEDLSGEDWEVMRSFRAVTPAISVKLMDSWGDAAYANRLEDYLRARQAVGWPVARAVKSGTTDKG